MHRKSQKEEVNISFVHESLEFGEQNIINYYFNLNFSATKKEKAIASLMKQISSLNHGKGQLEVVTEDVYSYRININFKPARIKQAQGYSFNETLDMMIAVFKKNGMSYHIDDSCLEILNLLQRRVAVFHNWNGETLENLLGEGVNMLLPGASLKKPSISEEEMQDEEKFATYLMLMEVYEQQLAISSPIELEEPTISEEERKDPIKLANYKKSMEQYREVLALNSPEVNLLAQEILTKIKSLLEEKLIQVSIAKTNKEWIEGIDNLLDQISKFIQTKSGSSVNLRDALMRIDRCILMDQINHLAIFYALEGHGCTPSFEFLMAQHYHIDKEAHRFEQVSSLASKHGIFSGQNNNEEKEEPKNNRRVPANISGASGSCVIS